MKISAVAVEHPTWEVHAMYQLLVRQSSPLLSADLALDYIQDMATLVRSHVPSCSQHQSIVLQLFTCIVIGTIHTLGT